MPEINNSLAMQVNSQPVDLRQTLGTLAQIDLAKAHAGLYGLQAQQEARKLAGFDYLKNNPTDYVGAIQRGLDPSVGSTLQQMGERQRQYGTNALGLGTDSLQQYTGAQKNMAETGKVRVETTEKGAELSGRIAQGVLSDPGNDRVWANAVNQYYDTFGGSSLERQQLLSLRDPNQRQKIAAAYASQAVPPGDFSKPHNVDPTARVTTPGAILNQTATAAGNRPPVPSTNRVVGDDEGVRRGLYDPTPEQRARGVIPSPNQQVAQRFGQMAPAMTPMQQKESTEYGETLGKLPAQLADKATAAKNMNFTLDQMRTESANWPFMGKGTEAAAIAASYLKPMANSMGIKAFDNFVGDYEAFQKNAGTLVRQAVKEVSSRAAVQEFQMIQNQLPSSDMTRQGFNKIVDQFQAVNDYQIAKQQAGQVWRDSRGSMDGFESNWNKNISPTAFLVSLMPADQIKALRGNLEKTAEGRKTLQSITRQIQWAKDNNLDGAMH